MNAETPQRAGVQPVRAAGGYKGGGGTQAARSYTAVARKLHGSCTQVMEQGITGEEQAAPARSIDGLGCLPLALRTVRGAKNLRLTTVASYSMILARSLGAC